MRTFLIVVLTMLLVSTASAQKVSMKPADLNPLIGGKWVGTLTYLDYGSKRSTAIKSDILITRVDTDKLSWIFDLKYPLEPKADRKETVSLSKDGKTFDGEKVVERTREKGGILKIVTAAKGRDDDKSADVRHIYLIARKSFSIIKQVRFDGEAALFVRNTYKWTR